jgi:hypothetical protein
MNDDALLADLTEHLATIDALIAEYEKQLKTVEAEVERDIADLAVLV